MKKLIIGCLSILLLGCSFQSSPKQKVTGLKTVNINTLKSLMKKKVRFMLYIGRPDCGDCQQFEPLLKEYLKENPQAGLYYLNIKAFRDEANKKNASTEAKAYYQNLRSNFKFNWTPTLEIIDNGKIGKQYQYLDEDYYEIEDRQAQIQKRKQFENEFVEYMNAYFKESKS